MRKMMIVVCITFLFWGCATTNKFNKLEINNDNSSLFKFNSYPINVSLQENKKILNQLNNDLISFTEYDSLLTKLGRKSTRSKFIENSICSTENEESFNKALKAMFFFEADSLLDIVNSQMRYLIDTDSTYILPYIILSYDYYWSDKLIESITLLERAQKITTDFDKSEINIFKAEIFQELNKIDEAIQEYKIAFTHNKELSQYNWDYLFDLYKQQKMFDKAEKLFYDTEKSSTDIDFRINNLDLLISIFIDQKNYDEVFKIYKSLADIYDSKSFEKEFIVISILQDNFTLAKQKLLEMTSVTLEYGATPVLKIPPIDSTNIFYKELIQKIEKSDSNIPDELLCYGLIILSPEINKNSWEDKNSEILSKGLAYLRKSKLDDPQIFYIIGYIYKILGEQTDSIQNFSKVDTISKYYPYALISHAHIIEEDIQLSLDLLLKAAAILENCSVLSKKIADLYYYNLEDYNNAIYWYQIVIDNEPENNLAFIELAESFLELDDTENALIKINSAIDNLYLEKDNWSRNWELSLALEVKGNILKKLEYFEDAKTNYLNSLKYNSNNMDVKLAIADVFYELDNYELAEKMYLSVIDSITVNQSIKYYITNYYNALSALNWHYMFYVQKPFERVKLFEQAISYFPSDDWCYRNLGSAYSELDNYLKAKNSFNKAIELNPVDYLNYSFFASSLKEQGKYAEAIHYYNEAIDIIQNSMLNNDNLNKNSSLRIIGNFYSTIAEIYIELLDYEQSISTYKKAISAYPDSTGIKFKFDLANVYFDNKDYVNAIENWEFVFNKNGDLYSLYNIGLSYFNIGENEKLKNALTYFEKVINLGRKKQDYEELISKSEEMVNLIETQINLIEWPIIINNNTKSNNQTISSIAKLYQLTNDYRELNNMFVDGVKETTPEYSEPGGYINGYNVSSKVYQSENLCDRFKSKLHLIDGNSNETLELISLWVLSAETRKEGIKLYSEGYYVKKKDYTGQYERGYAKIDVANQYYADGLKILKSLMQNYIEHFSVYGIETINDMIKYYEQKK